MKTNNAREIIHIQPLKAVETMKLRVAGYARVSSDSTDQLHSFAAQVSYYNKLIGQNDRWELTEIYADEGISGVSLAKREDFNRMVQDCRDGKIDRIITKSISRFGRNTMDNISTIRELQSLGVSVLFEQEGIDTGSITSETMVTLYSLFAQQESISISQNCKRGVRMRMANGTYIPSLPPYGYRQVDRKFEIYEPEAEIVRRIFREYLQGCGSREIAEQLNENQIPRKNGQSKWHTRTVAKILINEKYVGDMLHQQYYNEDAIPYRTRVNYGALPQYYVRNAHPAIIDRIQFELTSILKEQRTNKMRVEPQEYLLSQKVKCKHCGKSYRYKEVRGIVYWVCRGHDINKKDCPSHRIPEESIYTAFLRMYNKLKANHNTIFTPLIAGFEKLREQGVKDSAELLEINKQISETAQQIHAMSSLMTKGILDSAIFISQSNELKAKLQKLKQQKSRLLSGVKKDLLLDKIQELSDTLETAPDFITEMDEELFEDIVERIEAQDKQSIDFILLGGLRLTERL